MAALYRSQNVCKIVSIKKAQKKSEENKIKRTTILWNTIPLCLIIDEWWENRKKQRGFLQKTTIQKEKVSDSRHSYKSLAKLFSHCQRPNCTRPCMNREYKKWLRTTKGPSFVNSRQKLKEKKSYFVGPTEIWTRIAGFRVQSANHYTMGPFL